MTGILHGGQMQRLAGMPSLAAVTMLGICLCAVPPSLATGQSGRGARYQQRKPGIDREVSQLTQRLNLNAQQQAAVKKILESEHERYARLMSDQTLTAVDRFNRLRTMRENMVNQIKSVLDKDQQVKYDELRHPPQSDSQTEPEGKTPQGKASDNKSPK